MSDLDTLAADLAYAATSGAETLTARITHAGATHSELGIALPGTGLIHGGAERSVADTAGSIDATAAAMAKEAAEGGVKLVLDGHA